MEATIWRSKCYPGVIWLMKATTHEENKGACAAKRRREEEEAAARDEMKGRRPSPETLSSDPQDHRWRA